GDAEKRAAEAEKRAGEAARRTAPRTVSSEQAQALASALAPLRGRQLGVTLITSDGEAYQFGQQLVTAITAAGVNVAIDLVDLPGAGEPIEGLIVRAGPAGEGYAGASAEPSLRLAWGPSGNLRT